MRPRLPIFLMVSGMLSLPAAAQQDQQVAPGAAPAETLQAQAPAPGQLRSKPPPHERVEVFLRTVALFNQLEIELSEIALERSTSESVRRFAQRLRNDHAWMRAEVQKTAEAVTLDLKGLGPPLEHRRKDLRQRSGADFDGTYLRLQVALYEKMLHLFRQQTGEHEALHRFIQAGLPLLRTHREMALSLRAVLSSATGPDGRQGSRLASATVSRSERASDHQSAAQSRPLARLPS